MTEREPWPECKRDGCIGIQLTISQMCLAHASDEEQEAALRAIKAGGDVDARGVPLDSALLNRILAAVWPDDSPKAVIRFSRFDRATFTGDVRFDNVVFATTACFSGATFTGDAVFSGATFTWSAWFDGASFTGDAVFSGATVRWDAIFSGATFKGDVVFSGAIFRDEARFDSAKFTSAAMFGGARFAHSARFDGASFTGDTVFSGATFTRDARFDAANFVGDALFNEVIFRGPASFHGTRFGRARSFGPLLAHRGLVLDDVQFAQSVEIEASTTGMCCRRGRFPAGVQFRLRWARVVLDDTEFPAPSILVGIPRLVNTELAKREEWFARVWRRLLGDKITEQPQLVSLRRANVAGLGLSNVMMADCRFEGAHNLDMLRLETRIGFAPAPAPLGRLSWEGRQVIAEERSWRADRRHRWGWTTPLWPDWMGERPSALDPGQIAGVYRALRKGREDTKDEPGAADFYYGEMEMRRRARPYYGSARGRAERGILTAYWLVSGYGLRAWRAIAWLAALTALFALEFQTFGFAQPPRPVSYWTSLLYAFRAILSLADSTVQLTPWGQLLQGLLRLTGPVLLGLALLALRGRVKR